MKSKVIPITHRQDEAWQAYVDCRRQAEQTLKPEDGHRAGRAWARFVNLFLPSETRRMLSRED